MRLPGITFQTAPPPLQNPTPPMDIAAFVGFAARGPLHIPVAIEDPGQFREIFGTALPLAINRDGSDEQMALLWPTVEDFFANGGRRCWVVRVAKPVDAAQFTIPFLLTLPAAAFHPAGISARSAGAWAETLQVNARLRELPLFDLKLTFNPASDQQLKLLIPNHLANEIQPQELLHLDFLPDRICAYFPVEISGEIPENTPGFSAIATAAVEKGVCFGYDEILPAVSSDMEVRRIGDPGAVGIPAFTADDFTSFPQSFPEADDKITLYLAVAAEDRPGAGEILELRIDDQVYLFPVQEAEPFEGPASFSFPVAENDSLFVIRADRVYHRLSPQEFRDGLTGVDATITRQRFDLLVYENRQLQQQLADLAFAKTHARFWGLLLDDNRLFAAINTEHESGRVIQDLPALLLESLSPRFALGGRENPATFGFSFPLGMPVIEDTQSLQFPQFSAELTSRLQKEGLESFSAALFLDKDLCQLSSATLPAEAFNKKYVSRGRLEGIHALWPYEEISLISVPDAVHPAWQAHITAAEVIAAPALKPVNIDGQHGRLEWMPVDRATQYEMQGSYFADFHLVHHTATVDASTTVFPLEPLCPQTLWFRVRALVKGEAGPWSNTQSFRYPSSEFDDCEAIPLVAPVFSRVDRDGQALLLEWNKVDHAGSYELQSAGQGTGPAFDGPVSGIHDNVRTYRSYLPENQIRWFRVRAWFGETPGPWSETRIVGEFVQQRYQMIEKDAYSPADLRAVHWALIRFCAARNDIFAVLPLPRDFLAHEAMAYKKDLMPGSKIEIAEVRAEVLPLNNSEKRAASFAALYHPWIVKRIFDPALADGFKVMAIPAAGAVCGVMARLARERGAWLAPANHALSEAVGVAETLTLENRLDFLSEKINGITQNERGFMNLSAYTLSLESEWEFIHVRRLMILLRKVALELGERAVFQPNDHAFRRQMQREFERLFYRLYEKGAFAGASPGQAFRIVVDESVNTPQSVDLGRFMVEIRFAPSFPMMFLTVRLIQSNSNITIEE